VGFEVQAMPSFHFGPIQLEVLRGAPAGVMIPSVGEQNSAHVQKQRPNLGLSRLL
jgi:hypothetical protein